MAAVISSVMSTKDKVPFFVNRCEAMGIDVMPPDVNLRSRVHRLGNSIRFGLDAVKNVGHAAVETIIGARESGGEFESIWDFCDRVDSRAVNKRAIECLVKCGALDSTGAARGDARGARPSAVVRTAPGGLRAVARDPSSTSTGGSALTPRRRTGTASPSSGPGRGVRSARALDGEGDARHLPLGAPAERPSGALRARTERSLAAVAELDDGSWITVGGIVAEAKKVRTRSGGYVMFATSTTSRAGWSSSSATPARSRR